MSQTWPPSAGWCRYTFALPDLGGRTYRPLRDPDTGDDE